MNRLGSTADGHGRVSTGRLSPSLVYSGERWTGDGHCAVSAGRARHLARRLRPRLPLLVLYRLYWDVA